MPVAGGFRWRLNTIHRQNTYPETQISERTSKLRKTNKLPEKEVDQRKRAAEEIRRSEERFHVKACHGFERLFTKYSKV